MYERARGCVVVYYSTIVEIGHGLFKKFCPFGTRLPSTHCREFRGKREKCLVRVEVGEPDPQLQIVHASVLHHLLGKWTQTSANKNVFLNSRYKV